MSISIYTYHDPYKLNKEPFWDEIKSCPYFCASQTLVNGLKYIYKDDFKKERVTTVRNLTDSLFTKWESVQYIIKQHTDIDNIISNGLVTYFGEECQKNLAQAFLFNRDEVLESIRIMFELNINLNDILEDKLSSEQKFIVELYRKIQTSECRNDFWLKNDFGIEEINTAIKTAVEKAAHEEVDMDSLSNDSIVIHGVHQFSPIILRTIESIAKYKKVILLFNYQQQYKNAYQTWIDIYNAFDCDIKTYDNPEFRPTLNLPISYESNKLADNLGRLINGCPDAVLSDSKYELVEFDNVTEFASYVADIFAKAENDDPKNPMSKMTEQIYSADSSVNDILKIYFPEQFGERQFLDYPLGHFFLAIANMWDAKSNELKINNINDIKECFEAGILKESYVGELSTLFNKIIALFDGCTSIDEMLYRIKKVKRHHRHLSDPDKYETLNHVSYYHISLDELEKVNQALNELNELAAYFYDDFEEQSHNFKTFYKKLKQYIQNDIIPGRELDEEFSDIIRRVLIRLDEVVGIETSASFECLKSTMSIYLMQEAKPGTSANWIVRNFEQIDGDILRSNNRNKGEPVIYHFACLSDEDIDESKKDVFSWPLDSDFFEIAQEPVDWKYQVYVKSKKEYKNFKRYALLYGLEFNRGKFKLSYIHKDGEKEQSPYYLLKILGAKNKKYQDLKIGNDLVDSSSIQIKSNGTREYCEFDYYRYRICRYKFLLESIVEGTTVYKDSFLLLKYLEVLIENQAKEELQGVPVSLTVLSDKINDIFDELNRYFPFTLNVNRMDIVNNVRRRLLKNKPERFPILNSEDRKYMMIRELFIHKNLKDSKTFRNNILVDKFPDVNKDIVNNNLSSDILRKVDYYPNSDLWCQYCSNRELCLAFYSDFV